MPDKQEGHGKLKIFLGFAPGVGKSIVMLEEARRRRKRGQDVVLGMIDTKGRESTQEEIGDFEVVPPQQNGEVDIEAIINRRPHAVLIDDLQHTNRDGSLHKKRWQDIQYLLNAGVNVLTTMNIQHLESLNDTVSDITGLRVQDTVPDSVLHAAEEIELVDLTPRALINRLERGDVYPVEKLTSEIRDFYREGNLTALRELALREAAHHVDEDVVEYRRAKHIERPWAATDRIMICVSPTRASLRLIRRGWRLAQRFHGEIVAVHVEEAPPGDKERKILQNDFALAERLGIRTEMLKGDVAEQLIKYAQDQNVSQIILGHPERSRLKEMIKGSIINDIIRTLKTVDIMVMATDEPPQTDQPH